MASKACGNVQHTHTLETELTYGFQRTELLKCGLAMHKLINVFGVRWAAGRQLKRRN